VRKITALASEYRTTSTTEKICSQKYLNQNIWSQSRERCCDGLAFRFCGILAKRKDHRVLTHQTCWGFILKEEKIKYESPIIWAIASSLVEYLKYLASENGEITKVFLNLNFFDARKKAAGGVNT